MVATVDEIENNTNAVASKAEVTNNMRLAEKKVLHKLLPN